MHSNLLNTIDNASPIFFIPSCLSIYSPLHLSNLEVSTPTLSYSVLDTIGGRSQTAAACFAATAGVELLDTGLTLK